MQHRLLLGAASAAHCQAAQDAKKEQDGASNDSSTEYRHVARVPDACMPAPLHFSVSAGRLVTAEFSKIHSHPANALS